MSEGDYLLADEGRASLESFVFDGNEDARERFKDVFKSEVEEVIGQLEVVGTGMRRYEDTVPVNDRTLQVFVFLFQAYNAVVTSLHLLLNCLVVPSGNQMRLYVEAFAMALLCSHPGIGVFDEYRRRQKSYPVHKAVNKLNEKKIRRALDLAEGAIQKLVEVERFYNSYSHASMLAEGIQADFKTRRTLRLGAFFDPEKQAIYANELDGRLGAARALSNVIDVLIERLGGTEE